MKIENPQAFEEKIHRYIESHFRDHYKEMDAQNIMSIVKPKFCEVNGMEKSIVVEFCATKQLANPTGIIHGGAISTMFDNACGFLVTAMEQSMMITTTELYVSFVKAVQIGSSIRIKTKLISSGHTLYRIYGELYTDDSEAIYATAQATYMVLKKSLRV